MTWEFLVKLLYDGEHPPTSTEDDRSDFRHPPILLTRTSSPGPGGATDRPGGSYSRDHLVPVQGPPTFQPTRSVRPTGRE